MAKIVVTAGPIPAKLDSVKFITNRFKGGLILAVADALFAHEVKLVKWKWNSLEPKYVTDILSVVDVDEYIETVLNIKVDLYILGAAVANLKPSNPWLEKFPSHSYKEGEKFNIEFEIAPRLIDKIKKKYPRSGLVGYKLFDGSDEELRDAAIKLLRESKANIIFANKPQWAKHKKIMYTQDGAEAEVNFQQHIQMIDKLARSNYYSTEIVPEKPEELKRVHDIPAIRVLKSIYPRKEINGHVYGTFAYKTIDSSIVTTGRRKDVEELVIIKNVDHERRKVYTTGKATMNLPLLDEIFNKYPALNVIIHGHNKLDSIAPTLPYEFPGTDAEADLIKRMNLDVRAVYQIEHHGYIAAFRTIKETKEWISKI